MIVLALSATFVIGVILIYLFRNRGGFGKGSSEKPQFKKLQSISYNYGERKNQQTGNRQNLFDRGNRETGKRSPEASSSSDSIS